MGQCQQRGAHTLYGKNLPLPMDDNLREFSNLRQHSDAS